LLASVFCLAVAPLRVSADPDRTAQYSSSTAADGAATADGAAIADGEFVAVDLAREPSVNGKTTMILAYGIIIGILLVYSMLLLKRERSVGKAIAGLERRLKDDAAAPGSPCRR
jgi:hypothetical protein